MKKFIRKLVFLYNYHILGKGKSTSIIEEKIGQFKFKVYPSVFNPRHFISSEIFADFISKLDLKDKYILDMGCGSGIVSIFAAAKGARCIASDINPMAVRSVLDTARLNGFESKIKTVESDLFESLNPTPALPKEEDLVPSPLGRVGEGFDFIFFNPPYYKGNPKNNFERAFKGGENLEVIKEFAAQVKNYLAHGGITYLIISSDSDIRYINAIFIEPGYNVKISAEIKKFFETFYILEIVI